MALNLPLSPPPNSLSLIDADYLPWAYGNMPKHEISMIMHNWFEKIFTCCNSRRAMVLLKRVPQDNYRYQVAVTKPYKGTRDREFPEHYDFIMELLIGRYSGVTVRFAETDDAIAQLAAMLRNEGEDYIVVSDDKDLDMIPGWHLKHSAEEMYFSYDHVFMKQTFKMKDSVPVYKSTLEAHGKSKLWLQMIVGDNADNIAGIPGWGLKKAYNVGFREGISVASAKFIVWQLYKSIFPHTYKDRFIENYRLLKLIDNSQNNNLEICPITY